MRTPEPTESKRVTNERAFTQKMGLPSSAASSLSVVSVDSVVPVFSEDFSLPGHSIRMDLHVQVDVVIHHMLAEESEEAP